MHTMLKQHLIDLDVTCNNVKTLCQRHDVVFTLIRVVSASYVHCIRNHAVYHIIIMYVSKKKKKKKCGIYATRASQCKAYVQRFLSECL